MKDRITSTITRHIGVISESSRGWRLEAGAEYGQLERCRAEARHSRLVP